MTKLYVLSGMALLSNDSKELLGVFTTPYKAVEFSEWLVNQEHNLNDTFDIQECNMNEGIEP